MPVSVPREASLEVAEGSRDFEQIVGAFERLSACLPRNAQFDSLLGDLREAIDRHSGVQQESEERARLLLESTAEGIYGLDLEGQCFIANPASARLLGLENPDDLLGRDIHSLMHHTHRDGTPYPLEQCKIYNAIRAGQGIHCDQEVFWRRDGSCFDAEYWSYPVRRAGKIIGAVVAFIDISERRQLEEERKDLVRAISHDLRTPLNAVLLHAQRLKQVPASTEQVVKHARAIAAHGDQMNAMLQELNDLTRLESGQMQLELQELEVRPFIMAIKDRLAGTEMERVEVIVGEKIPKITADPLRLERIIFNLLGNAIKYSSPQAKVSLTAQVKQDRVLISVADRGCGIPREDIPRLFQRFFRGSGKYKAEGLGLGLYISRMLTILHGGDLSVSSELGKGSTFQVALPLVAAQH